MRGIAALALLCAAVQPVLGQQPTQAQQQKEHTVRKGDTLWDLARFYLNNPFTWPTIFEANRSVVENPHWIYPAERLIIPGQTPTQSELLGDPVAVADAAAVGPVSTRSRFYSPVTSDTSATATLITSESASVPLVQRLEWLAAPWITDSNQLPINAHVFKPADPRAESDRLTQLFHPRDKLFLSTGGSGMKPGDRLLVVRVGRNLGGVGSIVEPQGILQVDSVAANTAVATIVNQFGDLQVGDLTMPLPAVPPLPEDKLVDVAGGPTGKVMEFLVDQPLNSTTDFAFVNLGAAQGVTLGDELLAYVPAHRPSSTDSETLSEQAVAKLRVVRVTDGTATVRVLRLHNAGLERGLPVRVARKVP
jgi:LysM repeat protein